MFWIEGMCVCVALNECEFSIGLHKDRASMIPIEPFGLRSLTIATEICPRGPLSLMPFEHFARQVVAAIRR